MDFSLALVEMRRGKRMTRRDWTGPAFVVHQRGYPEGIGINANTAAALGIPEGTVVKFAPYLLKYTHTRVCMPYVPSQADLLAQDWKEAPDSVTAAAAAIGRETNQATVS